MNNNFELIIVEKISQGKNLADALGLTEKSKGFNVPNKDSVKFEKKIISEEKKLLKNNNKIIEMKEYYASKGKDCSGLKKFTTLIDKKEEIENKIIDLRQKYQNALTELKDVQYWGNDDIVIASCVGHLIGIQLSSKKDELNFNVKFKLPSALVQSEVFKWLKLKLIQYFLKHEKRGHIICATDYDREGQSIFGTIMEYEGIDFNDCYRMKFSTLESNVLIDAYENLQDFDVDLYESGKARRWMDFIIGYNLNPIFSRIYREGLKEHLRNELNFDESDIKQLIYGHSLNMGRVKLVIMNYIYENTKEQIDSASIIENCEMETSEKEIHTLTYVDNKNHTYELFNDDSSFSYHVDLTIFDFNQDNFIVNIDKIEYVEEESAYDEEEVPSLLNMTKVYQICSDLGASTNDITKVIQYLYLQKYTSYPRSKSEQWEKIDEDEKMEYSSSVLDALESCGYPIKEYYRETYGNEGVGGEGVDKRYSHPCIHPLPSVTPEMVEYLKQINPLAYLVFNKIAIHTLKCFEKLPIIKKQKIHYELKQGEETLLFNSTRKIEVIETNILDFEGINRWWALKSIIDLTEGQSFDVDVITTVKSKCSLDRNHHDPTILTDFDVVNYLNENEIGTDATRSVILNTLIELQYLESNQLCLATYLGNTMSELANKFVEFIDIDYTINMENKLNEIEEGNMDVDEFEEEIKTIIEQTNENILENQDDIIKIFMDVPLCHTHNTQMLIRVGRYGKYLQCPYAIIEDEKCDQRISL